MTVTILRGDCRHVLKTLPDESIHCIVTSPPYYALRDYNAEGQIGLERDWRDYLGNMVEVFREARRVLRRDGTCWVNMGDSYVSGGGTGHQGKGGQRSARRHTQRALLRGAVELKPKDLMGMPWRLAFALQDDGWWLRQDNIWHKPNPMPESVVDRCTKAHEYVFMLTKAERYYFDQESILEPISENTHLRVSQATLAEQLGSDRAHAGGKTNGNIKAVLRKMAPVGQGIKNNEDMNAALVAPGRVRRSGNKERKPASERGAPEGTGKNQAGSVPWEGYVRNRRSVWTVTTQPFSEAHFATFPPALIEPCVKAGCPEGGVVLDPFFGAGTTGLVADRLKRDCIGIEINPQYAEMAKRRIEADGGMLARVVLEDIERKQAAE